MAHDIVVACPNFELPFGKCTDTDNYQLGAVIVENNIPMTLFNRKFSDAH